MSTSTLIWVLLIGAILLFYFSRMRGAKGVRTVNAQQFQEAIDESKNKVLIDVRTPGEFKGGHIPAAINIPVSDLSHRIGEIAKDKTVLIYCQSGMRSRQAGAILSKHGFTDIVNLQGGIMSWKGKVKR